VFAGRFASVVLREPLTQSASQQLILGGEPQGRN
jgi:hypothetical protein